MPFRGKTDDQSKSVHCALSSRSRQNSVSVAMARACVSFTAAKTKRCEDDEHDKFLRKMTLDDDLLHAPRNAFERIVVVVSRTRGAPM